MATKITRFIWWLCIAAVLGILPAIGRAQEMAPDLCNAVRSSLGINPLLVGLPDMLTFEGKSFPCQISKDEATWTCRLGLITACRARDAAEGTGADPAPFYARYDNASHTLKNCLSNRSPRAYEAPPEAVIEHYVQVVHGIEFPPGPGDQSELSANATITGRLDYEPNRLCETLAVDVSVR